jgi:lipopolysaccharide export LptBFGC system permease protein LptF
LEECEEYGWKIEDDEEGMFIFIFFFLIFIIDIIRFSQEDIDKIKDGVCPYCGLAIVRKEDCYRCTYVVCGRIITFKDVNASISHPAQHRGIYKPNFLIPNGSQPTETEQNAFNKLSDKDHALEYLLYYFYFILFLDA